MSIILLLEHLLGHKEQGISAPRHPAQRLSKTAEAQRHPVRPKGVTGNPLKVDVPFGNRSPIGYTKEFFMDVKGRFGGQEGEGCNFVHEIRRFCGQSDEIDGIGQKTGPFLGSDRGQQKSHANH